MIITFTNWHANIFNSATRTTDSSTLVVKFVTFTAFVAVYSNNEKSAKFSYVSGCYCALSVSCLCDAVRRKQAAPTSKADTTCGPV
jgi:hypothetical protein